MVDTAHWRALGTSVYLLTHDLDPEPARATVAGVLADVDATYSRFRPDSELRRIQAHPGRDVAVSELLGRAIATALQAARRTDGAVDPTVGRAMRAIGYDDDFARLAGSPGPIAVHLETVPGWRSVRLDERARRLRLPAGVELDLGSTGKAMAADLAAEAALAASPAGGVLVSLGGDIATAGRAPVGGWRILAAEDSDAPVDVDGEVVAIDRGALATSSTRVRRWRSQGIELHHLVDPRTGGPVDGPWRTASVVADTCVDANTAATAAIVLGDAAVDWLQMTGLPARLVDRSGNVTRLNGWPVPAVQVAAGIGVAASASEAAAHA